MNNDKHEMTGTASVGSSQPYDDARVVLVYATFPSLDLAERIAAEAVDGGLAACVNILPVMISIYRWQGERHRDAEVVGLFKTTAGRAYDVVAAIRSRHPYDNPAIMMLDVAGGSAAFLAWVAGEVAQRGDTKRP